jgi:mono/diheme cytochrome c family protein
MPSSVARFALLGTLCCAPAAQAASPALSRPVVAGFERFSAADKGDGARGGRLLLGELNCVSCHAPAAGAPSSRKQAPVLDAVAARVRIGYLRKYLADPQAVKPGTTMPNLLAGDPEAKEKVEALVHFLAGTGSPRFERKVPGKMIAAGRELYHKVGCFACHGTRNASGDQDKVLSTSVPLGDLKAKYTASSLAAFLQAPHVVRPSGRMPKLLSDTAEARSVAAYLLQGSKDLLVASQGSARYSYYEGSWGKLPNFAALTPKRSGTSAGFDLGAARRDSNYAMKFDAFLKIDRAGTYRFTLMSDDGSKLLIDDQTVVDNDGVHAPQTKRGEAKLTKGIHKVVISFFQVGGGAELDVQIDSPGVLAQQPLGDLVAASAEAFDRKPKPKSDDPDAIEVQPALAAKGKELFALLGCASCHALNDGGKPIASARPAPGLGKLNPESGCLSAKPGKGVPAYGLDDVQRRALRAALKEPARQPTPAESVATTLMTFNCYACHVRDGVGGPEEAANKLFVTTQPEMGDEGRVPPPLDGVGAKLTTEYFRQILENGAHDRPYMHTRMPGFGLANVGHLVEAFAGLDKLPAVEAVKFKETPAKVKSTARHLVGGQAFGCIKCHTFAGHKAEGVQGIDMALMPKRLKRDWFHAYVSDPPRIRPGTRMPSAFPDGKSVLPEFFDGTALRQVEAMWLYLQDGKAPLPIGLGKVSIPLTPTTSAILYRNFIQGAGTRAIGVGYPESAHLAFDANEMRLALLWQGAFIDAARHWTDRGSGWEGPLGDNILALHLGAPFAVLEKPDSPWPTDPSKKIGYRFLGYTLSSDDRPTFRYSYRGVTVEDFPNPVHSGKDVHMRRRLDFTAAKEPQGLLFRAAVGNKIVALEGGWYQVDDAWKIQVPAGVTARVRKSAGKAELLVPVRFAGGKAQLVHEYAW